jgi:hypothetical protein
MKRTLHQAVLAVVAATFVVFATGCETLQTAITMEPIENYGGGGGDAS